MRNGELRVFLFCHLGHHSLDIYLLSFCFCFFIHRSFNFHCNPHNPIYLFILRWDGWMASPTQWAWVWANSGSWWWTGRPGRAAIYGVTKSRTWLSDWTELNWTESLTARINQAFLNQVYLNIIKIIFILKLYPLGLPGGSVVKNPPANVGDTVSNLLIQGEAHVPRSH